MDRDHARRELLRSVLNFDYIVTKTADRPRERCDDIPKTLLPQRPTLSPGGDGARERRSR